MPKGVTVTDDGNRLRVTASASDWSNLWPLLADIKPLLSCQWEGVEQAAGQRTSVWVR